MMKTGEYIYALLMSALFQHEHPSKKVTQHGFDRLYFFNHTFIFVMLDINGKPVYSPFD